MMRLFIEELPNLENDWVHQLRAHYATQYNLADGIATMDDVDAERMQYMLNSLENAIGLTYDYRKSDKYFDAIWLPMDEFNVDDPPEDQKIDIGLDPNFDMSGIFVSLYCSSYPKPTAHQPDREYIDKLGIVIDRNNRYAKTLNAERETFDDANYLELDEAANGMLDYLRIESGAAISRVAMHRLSPAHSSAVSTIMMIMLSGRYRDELIDRFTKKNVAHLRFASILKNSHITQLIEDYLSCSGDYAVDDGKAAIVSEARKEKLVNGMLSIGRYERTV